MKFITLIPLIQSHTNFSVEEACIHFISCWMKKICTFCLLLRHLLILCFDNTKWTDTILKYMMLLLLIFLVYFVWHFMPNPYIWNFFLNKYPNIHNHIGNNNGIDCDSAWPNKNKIHVHKTNRNRIIINKSLHSIAVGFCFSFFFFLFFHFKWYAPHCTDMQPRSVVQSTRIFYWKNIWNVLCAVRCAFMISAQAKMLGWMRKKRAEKCFRTTETNYKYKRGSSMEQTNEKIMSMTRWSQYMNNRKEYWRNWMVDDWVASAVVS